MINQIQREKLQEITKTLHDHSFSGIKFYIKQEQTKVVKVFMGALESLGKSDDTMYFVEAGKERKRCFTYFNSLSNIDGIINRMEESFRVAIDEYIYTPLKNPVEVKDEFLEDESVELGNPLELNKAIELNESVELYELTELGKAVALDEPVELIVDQLKKAEAEALEYENIFSVYGCEYRKYEETVTMLDEDGNEIKDTSGYCSGNISVYAKRNKDKSVASAFNFGKNISSIDLVKISREASKTAIQGLGGEAIGSGIYPVILQNNVIAEILEAYLPIFYGDSVEDGVSKLGNELGREVAVNGLTLVEDPQCDKGRSRRGVDDEGHEVRGKYLIEEGILKNILYNKSTATRNGAESTGNGFKSSITSDVGIGITNVVVKGKEQVSFTELLENMGEGLLITEVDGVFAGTNINNGEFSLIAKGNRIEQGSICSPFCDVTISGNIYELFKNIAAFGEDEVCTPPGYASVISPSIFVKEITISGV